MDSCNFNSIPVETFSSTNSVKNLEEKLAKGIYVPLNLLKEAGIDPAKFISVKSATEESLAAGKTRFGKAKLNTEENVKHPAGDVPRLFPAKSLTRLLTGDVKPEWLLGIGMMNSTPLRDDDKRIPEEQKHRHHIVGEKKLAPKVTEWGDYTDVFVTNLEEYESKGIRFDPSMKNNCVDMAEKLALSPTDLAKIKKDGAWLVLMDPSIPVAVPTERGGAANPGFIEGGYTADGNREWVSPNIPLDAEVRSGRIKIFKMDTAGNTVQWKFFKGTLYPDSPKSADGKSPEGSWAHAIEMHTSSVATKMPQSPIPTEPKPIEDKPVIGSQLPSRFNVRVKLSTANKLSHYPIIASVIGVGRTFKGGLDILKELGRSFQAFFTNKKYSLAKRHMIQGLKEIARGLVEIVPVVGNIFASKIDKVEIKLRLQAKTRSVATERSLKLLTSGNVNDFKRAISIVNKHGNRESLDLVLATFLSKPFTQDKFELDKFVEALEEIRNKNNAQAQIDYSEFPSKVRSIAIKHKNVLLENTVAALQEHRKTLSKWKVK